MNKFYFKNFFHLGRLISWVLKYYSTVKKKITSVQGFSINKWMKHFYIFIYLLSSRCNFALVVLTFFVLLENSYYIHTAKTVALNLLWFHSRGVRIFLQFGQMWQFWTPRGHAVCVAWGAAWILSVASHTTAPLSLTPARSSHCIENALFYTNTDIFPSLRVTFIPNIEIYVLQ